MPFGCFSFAVSDSVLAGNELQPLSKVQMPARMDFSIWTPHEMEPAYKAVTDKVNAFNQNGVLDRHKFQRNS